MFERFTAEARESVRLAQDEARALGHPFIGTEHLLLGLLSGNGAAADALHAQSLTAEGIRRRLLALENGGLDPDALATVGIDFEVVKATAEAHLGPGVLDRRRRRVKNGHLPLAKRGKKVLELALREAIRLDSHEIRSGHVLLGLLRDGGGPAISLLHDARLDLDLLRNDVLARLEARAA